MAFLRLAAVSLLLGMMMAPAYSGSFSQQPDTGLKPQPCQDDTVRLVLDRMRQVAQRRHAPRVTPTAEDVVNAVCKVSPTSAGNIIVAVAYLQKSDTDDEGASTVELALIDARRRQVIALGDSGIYSGGPNPRFDEASLWIDTARYDLAPGARAFGIDMMDGDSPNCGDGIPGPARYLFVRDGGKIRPVLQELFMSHQWLIQRGGDRCNSTASPQTRPVTESSSAALSLADTSSHGYRDLWVRNSFVIDGEKLGGACRYKLKYDGTKYPLESAGNICDQAERDFVKAAAQRLHLKSPW